MISSVSIPWFDPVLYYIYQHCEKLIKHYDTNINVCYTGCCCICKKVGMTHMHHIIPRCYLGAHTRKNLIELCPSCHRKTESGIIKLENPGKLFYWGIRKKHKMELKLFRNAVILKYGCWDIEKVAFLMKKHLGIDSTTKYLLKQKDFNRLNILKEEWKKENLIK